VQQPIVTEFPSAKEIRNGYLHAPVPRPHAIVARAHTRGTWHTSMHGWWHFVPRTWKSSRRAPGEA